MRISSSIAVLAFAAALGASAAAQAQTTPAFDAARISEDIRVLSDDSFEGAASPPRPSRRSSTI
ncbi:hypothetical protein V8F63_10790 [Brevundimonas sp. LF-1]|uniref:hypothetical protein n=1 Tax=Brevundimonas sp. LF-1 TaxID=3126100 RepID=UPI0030E51B16